MSRDKTIRQDDLRRDDLIVSRDKTIRQDDLIESRDQITVSTLKSIPSRS